MSIRLVIAEDNALLREGMRTLVGGEPGIEVVASCGDLAALIEAIDTWQPDVVLTDIRMPPTRRDEGIQAARHCRAHHPGTAVLLLSQYVEPAYVRTLLSQGTEGRGYLLKERVADVDELLRAVRTVAEGGSVVDPKVVEALVQTRSRRGDLDLGRLSPRELEVLAEMAQGHNNAAIAASLVITQRAVEKHINSVFSKLGVGDVPDSHPRVRAVLAFLSSSSG
jgi:DNA-binding NarL/FixJ family response regulator